jgi:hypothetical protein
MLTEDIIEVKKNKKKYKMGYNPETLSYPHKIKDIYEAEKKDTKAATKEPAKKEKKKQVDPMYQRMINYAKAELPYVKDEDDAISRLLQNRSFEDHEHNLKQQKEIKNLQKSVADLQDELHDLKRSLKTKDRPDTWRTRDTDPRKR